MQLIDQFPELRFEAGDYFMWQPGERAIVYDPDRLAEDKGKAQLLHEVGHALLNHRVVTDETRFSLERDAWDVARILAQKLGIKSQELYIARQLRELEELGYA